MNSKIFVSCASLQDQCLASTLKNCLENAASPQDIFFGIFDQSDGIDLDLVDLIDKHGDHVRYKKVGRKKAKGLGYARSQAFNLIQDEEWVLQIDSHMSFLKNWDKTLFQQWKDCNDENAILSTALHDCNPSKNKTIGILAKTMKYGGLNGLGLPIIKIKDVGSLKIEKHQIAVTHFIFCKSEVVKKVPIDPGIGFNAGEEFSYSFRLYSHGFNIYAPPTLVMGHHYDGSRKPKVRREQVEIVKPGTERVKALFNLSDDPVDLGYYGAGSVRTLDQYLQELNISDLKLGAN